MKLQDIIHVVENIAPPHFAAAWDNGGMQVAAHCDTITCLALCLDPTPASIKSALHKGAQCIISHHPLLMQGRLPSALDDYHQVLSTLFAHQVPLYAAHTALDINPLGPVGWLARALALTESTVLDPVSKGKEETLYGYGIVGNLPHTLDYDVFLQTLGQYIPLDTATVCGVIPSTITRVAYCPGSGASLVKAAHAHNAHIFITGDVKYHSALESPLCMWDVGHHSLEEIMMLHFTHTLRENLPTLRIEYIESVSPLRKLV